MSYDVHLFRKETQEKEIQLHRATFFDEPENLVPFTSAQTAYLQDKLARYGYQQKEVQPSGTTYQHPKLAISARLTNRGLYFTASWNQDAIFEAGMTASELTDNGEFVKYDPQNGAWEAPF